MEQARGDFPARDHHFLGHPRRYVVKEGGGGVQPKKERSLSEQCGGRIGRGRLNGQDAVAMPWIKIVMDGPHFSLSQHIRHFYFGTYLKIEDI